MVDISWSPWFDYPINMLYNMHGPVIVINVAVQYSRRSRSVAYVTREPTKEPRTISSTLSIMCDTRNFDHGISDAHLRNCITTGMPCGLMAQWDVIVLSGVKSGGEL
jgi:hypothetical protein